MELSGFLKNTERGNRFSWVAPAPTKRGYDVLGAEAIYMSISVTGINIALQNGYDNLERWCEKYLGNDRRHSRRNRGIPLAVDSR